MDPNLPVTALLRSMSDGDAAAADELLRRIQDELRALARAKLNGSRGLTLQPTALVNEAWIRMVGHDPNGWADRRHFFFVAARAMNDVLVEDARRRATKKRGGGWRRHQIEDFEIPADMPAEDLLALDAALERLERIDGRAAEVVRLRFFVGLDEAEVASALEISTSTVRRDWRYARARLLQELVDEGTG